MWQRDDRNENRIMSTNGSLQTFLYEDIIVLNKWYNPSLHLILHVSLKKTIITHSEIFKVFVCTKQNKKTLYQNDSCRIFYNTTSDGICFLDL